jgi:anthranilate synthase component 1
MPSPDRDGLAQQAFLEAVAAGNSFIPLWKRWPADLETPLTTWLKVGAHHDHGVLLESVEGGERIGRWSFVVSDPLWTLTSRGDRSERRWRDGRCEPLQGNPFTLLRQCLEPLTSAPIPGLPPVGQLFGFWGYELIRWIEPSVPVHQATEGAPPDGCWMLADSLLVFDQVKRQITAVAYADLSGGQDPQEAYAAAAARIIALEERMHGPLPDTVTPLHWHDASASEIASVLTTRSNVGQEAFEAAVRRGEEHIEAGDVFQLVLSQRLDTRIDRDPFELYRSLRMVNPSPYMAFFNFGGWYLIGSSPEVMVKAEPTPNGAVKASLRPIAGTRPRGADEAEDLALEADLLADPKERAEHVMLVDLGRNDLGRVCQPGTVQVSDLMVIERYSHVMHIVSNVEGKLQAGLSALDVLKAAFPAGTLSGAPKVRAMEVIDELEPVKRGIYGGAIGYLGFNGDMDLAIAIRTAVIKDGHLHVQAGAGIVADSDPTSEWQETQNKARAVLRAAEMAENGLDTRFE